MTDGRVVSAHWGGNWKLDGTAKKKKRFEGKDAIKAREKEMEARRGAKRKAVRELFVSRRDALEKLKLWNGPRKYEEWLLELAQGVLAGGEQAAAPEMPKVSWLLCLCE